MIYFSCLTTIHPCFPLPGGSGGGSASGHSAANARHMNSLTMSMLIASAAAAALAIGAVAAGQRRTNPHNHNLKGILVKRMTLFKDLVNKENEVLSRPERRVEMSQQKSISLQYAYKDTGDGPANFV